MQSPFLSKYHWPMSHMPETVCQHFSNTKYHTQKREVLRLYKREDFLNALNSNDEFSKFWTHIQEQHPSKKGYFLSLINEDKPFDHDWIFHEYHTYQQQKAFEALSEEELKTLKDEFYEFRHSAYRAAIQGESTRLTCEISDVRPICHVVLRKPDHDEESMLARLPDEIFGRIVPNLGTLDIFRMTLVCRNWKSMILNIAKHLKRAEHAVTTHLVTFTDWMDPASMTVELSLIFFVCPFVETPKKYTFFHQYQMFSWCLTKWYCGISESFETLILDHEISYTYLSILLQSCPNLKHLQIGAPSECAASLSKCFLCTNDLAKEAVHLDDASLARVRLIKLEVFMCFCSPYWSGPNKPYHRLHRDILLFSPSLRVFKGPTNLEDLAAIVTQYPTSNFFSKLIALDLEKITPPTLEILAQIDGLQLRYLRLGSDICNAGVNIKYKREQLGNAFYQLLPKLSKLEMLKTLVDVGITNEMIQLMTDMELNIEWAVLYPSIFTADYDYEGDLPPGDVDPLRPEVLDAFRSMLLSKNPSFDLSKIQFVLVDRKASATLKALDTGFTFWSMFETGSDGCSGPDLHDSKIKRCLGIDF